MSTPTLSTERVRVLLVDDTPDVRFLVRLVLDRHDGFEIVAEAQDGAEAVELVGRCQPDLVLLDLAMPGMDGLEALPLIRAACPSVKVIVFSGFEGVQMAQAALDAGASTYLQKGGTAAEFMDTISRALGSPQVPSQPPRIEPQPEPVSSELELLRNALATATHELRSPSTILIGLARTLRKHRDSLDADVLAQLFDAIERQARVIDRLSTDLLTASQSDRGVLIVEPAEMSLAEAIGDAVELFGQSSGIAVCCPPELTVSADWMRVQQMLTNLLSNALKYGGTPIEVEVHCQYGCAVVRVADAGKGVDDEFAPRLFERYARAQGLRGSGTGIGLYVVRSLAQAQNGAAWYEKSSAGGAAFCFSLPLLIKKESGAE